MDRLVPTEFAYDYGPSAVRYGPGSTVMLESLLEREGVERSLVVCGQTVGQTSSVIDPVINGLGERVVGVFAETTPEKSVQTALDGVAQMHEKDVDGIVALGGGSSMDIARAMSVFAVEDGDPLSLHASVGQDGGLELPDLDAEKLPVFAVPTTLSGAELTSAAGVNYPDEGTVEGESVREGPIYDPQIVPQALIYDPNLFATTPRRILAASAMNGLDHGIEMLYSRHANPLTDAMAMQGIRILNNTLPQLVTTDDESVLGDAAIGVYTASYGLIDPTADANKYNIIHAFGHIISRNYSIQQGALHGIIAPHVLRYLFGRDAGRLELLAEAFDAKDNADPASGVINRITSIRDALELPTQLRLIEDLEKNELTNVATAITKDVGLKNGPPGLELTSSDFEVILENAW